MGSDWFVFDFDGVVCDSARETAVSAWRAGRDIWPEWTSPEPAAANLERFCRLRPFLETGYQAIGLMRMAWASDLQAEELSVPLVVEWIDRLYAQGGFDRRQMVDLFGKTRDAWIAQDPADWLSRHRFYPGMVELLGTLSTLGRVVILSTKQERFIKQLLAGHGVDLPDDAIFGLEQKASKPRMLREFRKPLSPGCAIHFVEDRMETLSEVVAEPPLSEVKLYLAEWGYNTASQRAEAAKNPRIRLVASPANLKAALLPCPQACAS